MSNLIDRQAAIDAVNEWLKLYVINRTMSNITSIQDILRHLPSAQPEIIRCKDCRYASPNGVYGCKLERFSIHGNDERLYRDDLCSCAEGRTDEGFNQQTGGD